MTESPLTRQRGALVIEPTGGLCNRLRALDSASAYATACGRRLVVIWIPTPSCNARFADLFVVPASYRPLIEIHSGWQAAAFAKLVHLAFILRPEQRIDHPMIIAAKRQTGSYFEGIQNQLARLSARRVVYLRSFNRFYYSATSRPYHDFIPIEAVRSVIDRYEISHRVGVHVRRTDNQKSARAGSLGKFFALMRMEIESDRHTEFFVATDDPQIEEALRREFQTRILVHDKRSFSRNDLVGIQDAVVDLYCLAGCRKLIGSYWSSFSEAAYEMHGIPHIIVRPES